MGNPFKTILIPVDFSPPSAEALRYAVTFAEHFRATLLVLHILQAPQEATSIAYERGTSYKLETHPSTLGGTWPISWTLGEESSAIDPCHRAYKALQQFLPPQLQHERVGLHITQGHPREEILRLARQADIDLIVMGTHGRVGLEYAARGSIAEQIVRAAPCPVFTIKI